MISLEEYFSNLSTVSMSSIVEELLDDGLEAEDPSPCGRVEGSSEDCCWEDCWLVLSLLLWSALWGSEDDDCWSLSSSSWSLLVVACESTLLTSSLDVVVVIEDVDTGTTVEGRGTVVEESSWQEEGEAAAKFAIGESLLLLLINTFLLVVCVLLHTWYTPPCPRVNLGP